MLCALRGGETEEVTFSGLEDARYRTLGTDPHGPLWTNSGGIPWACSVSSSQQGVWERQYLLVCLRICFKAKEMVIEMRVWYS